MPLKDGFWQKFLFRGRFLAAPPLIESSLGRLLCLYFRPYRLTPLYLPQVHAIIADIIFSGFVELLQSSSYFLSALSRYGGYDDA